MVMNVAGALSAYHQTANNSLMGKMGVADVSGGNFSDELKGFIGDAVESLKKGEQAAAAGASGKANLQEVAIAISNAEMQLQTITALRDKVIGAYQEIIRMPI